MTFMAFLNQDFSDYVNYIPLIGKPPVDQDTYKLDRDLLDKRTEFVAFAALIAMAASFAIVQSHPIIAVGITWALSMVIGVVVLALDEWRSARAAHHLAVNDYLSEPHPSENAFLHIGWYLGAAQLLIDQKGNLNKTTDTGKRFLDFPWKDFDVFKLFVDHGFDWKAQTQDKTFVTPFSKVVSWKNPDYLEYLLQHGKIEVNDFTNEEQLSCWTKIGHARSAELLVKHGFDIDIRWNGRTPLLDLIKKASSVGGMAAIDAIDMPDWNAPLFDEPSLSPTDRIRILLANGADPKETFVDQNGIAKNAFELNADPAIALILNEYNQA